MTFEADTVVVDVGLRRRRLVCPQGSFATAARYDTRPVFSRWRHTDMGRWKVVVRAGLRRLVCPAHGVRVEQVRFARARCGFSRDIEDLVAFLATKTDKTTEHWVHLRTTISLSRPPRPCDTAPRSPRDPAAGAAGLAMAFKLIQTAQHRWRAGNASHLVALVRAGATFGRGKLIARDVRGHDGGRHDQEFLIHSS